MLEININFLSKINKDIFENLNIAIKDIQTNPKNSMNKIYISAELVINDILNKEKLTLNSKKSKYTFLQGLELLKQNNIVDLKLKSTFELIRETNEEYRKTKIVDKQWVNLCLNYMIIICKWYAKKYYYEDLNINPKNIEINNKQPLNNPKTNIIKIDTSVTSKYINNNESRKAYTNLSMKISNEFDVLLFLASVNLINAYVKQNDAILYMQPKYIFKDILVERLEEIIRKDIKGVSIYFNRETTYIKVFNLQFSFKFLPTSEFMNKYMASPKNKKQQWCGMRLQPCASSILSQAENIHKLRNQGKNYVM